MNLSNFSSLYATSASMEFEISALSPEKFSICILQHVLSLLT